MSDQRPGPTLRIGGREVGAGHPCYVIAEAGVNHNGSLDLARRLVDAAARAGADAVKFQTFVAEEVVAPVAPKASYQKASGAVDESQLEMVRRLELSFDAFAELARHAGTRDITFLSTPFDRASADLLVRIGVPAIKVPSGELTNLTFLRDLAARGRPLIVSTGMADLAEVRAAVGAIREAGCREFALLQCVSNYPAAPADANLRAMETMAAEFGVPVGYSDHTLGLPVALAAAALGACIVEKHFTLDRALEGPDHRSSLEPDELAELVAGIRAVESALGDGRKVPAASEADTAAVARRSLVAARDIPAGAVLTEELIALRRPGTGLPPSMFAQVVGRAVRARVPAGTLISLDQLA